MSKKHSIAHDTHPHPPKLVSQGRTVMNILAPEAA